MCAVVTAFAICCHAASVFSSYTHWANEFDKRQEQRHDEGILGPEGPGTAQRRYVSRGTGCEEGLQSIFYCPCMVRSINGPKIDEEAANQLVEQR